MLTMQSNLPSLRRAWPGWIAVVEVIDKLLQMLKSRRIVPRLVLVVSLPFNTKLDFSFSSYLLSVQYIVDLPLFLIVNYNRWSRVIVLTR